MFYTMQKHQSRGVARKRYSENMQQIYRRTLMPKCNFNRNKFIVKHIETTASDFYRFKLRNYTATGTL